ncbi:MAG: hypothetical protein ACD_10C00542G0001 [uncultured bacterium]|nr:MAG: hypothetical protein ACD_10C00542G0001 [uncultured bacterium]
MSMPTRDRLVTMAITVSNALATRMPTMRRLESSVSMRIRRASMTPAIHNAKTTVRKTVTRPRRIIHKLTSC